MPGIENKEMPEKLVAEGIEEMTASRDALDELARKSISPL